MTYETHAVGAAAVRDGGACDGHSNDEAAEPDGLHADIVCQRCSLQHLPLVAHPCEVPFRGGKIAEHAAASASRKCTRRPKHARQVPAQHLHACVRRTLCQINSIEYCNSKAWVKRQQGHHLPAVLKISRKPAWRQRDQGRIQEFGQI